MAVVFDANSTGWTNLTSGTSMSHGLMTVGSGSNRALIAIVVYSLASFPTGVAVTWDSGGTNQAMTLITGTTAGDAASATQVALYGLVAPTSGNKTLAISWTSGAMEAHCCAVSFTGVNQAGGNASFANGVANDTAAQTSGSITVTCPSGDMAVALFSNNSWTFSTTSGTTIQLQNVGPNDGSIALFQNGAGSTVCTCSGGASSNIVQCACDVVAAQSGSFGIPQGTIFTPGRRFGPTRGLRSTQAFPPIIPPPGPGIQPGTIFTPGKRFGPTRGLRPTQAFPPAPAITTAALAGLAGMMVKSTGAQTGAAAMRGLGLFEVKATAQPSGKVPLLGAANAQLKTQASPSFAAAMLGRAAAMVKALAQPSGVVPLLARAATMVKALAQPSGVVPLLGAAAAMLKTQSSFTAFFALTARAVIQVKAQAAATGAAAMAARATAMTMARGSASGVVGLLGNAAAMIKIRPGIAAFFALTATLAIQIKAQAAATGAAAMSARSTIIATARGSASGVAGLFGNVAAMVKSTSTMSLTSALGALSSRLTIQVKAMQSSISTSGIAKAFSGMWLIRARRRNKR